MEEKEKVISDFKKVISYSQNIPNPKVEDLIEQCFSAKQRFIQAFGNNLIYEYPEKVSFELSNKEKISKVVDFCEMIENKFEEYELSEFIYSERENFYANRVSAPYVIKSGDIIPKDMKIVKAFKYFEDDPYLLRKLQDLASNLIQEDKITGTLCFSVHPLDFLSSSENNHKWRSCHALDGEYRAGNLSYMVDSCTFLCYLKSEEETILPNFPHDVAWNNKKWRTLLFLNNYGDMLFAGRQYPFTSETGIEFVKEILYQNLGLGPWSDWVKDKFRGYNGGGAEGSSLTTPYIGVGHKLRPLSKVIRDKNPNNALHFNDLLKSSCYDPIYAYKTNIRSGMFDSVRIVLDVYNDGYFEIGGDIKCLRCGQDNIITPEFMTCQECELQYGTSDSEDIGYCPCCGARFFYEDGYYVDLSYETVCRSCAEDYVVSCSCCGDTGYSNSDSMIYSKARRGFYCINCYEPSFELEEEDYGDE